MVIGQGRGIQAENRSQGCRLKVDVNISETFCRPLIPSLGTQSVEENSGQGAFVPTGKGLRKFLEDKSWASIRDDFKYLW